MAKDQVNEKYKDAVGKKWDGDKLRWDLLDLELLEPIVYRFSRGAEKYGCRNWQLVDDAEERYYAAGMRHLCEYRKGNINDDDPQFEKYPSHLAAACWNFLVLLWFEQQRTKNKNKK